MDALELLLNRHSQPRLTAPAPDAEALLNIQKAALKAPDHAALRPWRYIVCEGDGLKKLGDLFEQAAIESGMSDRDIDRAPELPKRAPMVIVAITKYKDHPKVPQVEQVASTACAIMAMQMAAMAQGFQGIWRTGAYAFNDYVKKGLDLDIDDEIVGFLYLGTSAVSMGDKPSLNPDDYFEYWR
ncbi:MAG: NAD(P)H nitroreductase [Alteromonadaceae bacterium]|nr:NAD(P)H nitroreductase [Alteromonadaceae bacterium]